MKLTKTRMKEYVSRIGGKKNLSFVHGFDTIFAKAMSIDSPTLPLKLEAQRNVRDYFNSLDEKTKFNYQSMMISFLEGK